MRRTFYWLLLLLLGLPNLAVATREICGTPPPDQFKEENSESIKGELTGKANLLSSYVGKAELGGKIEAAKQEIFAKYPDANAAYLDRYFAYLFCFAIFDPKNPRSPEDKIKAIQEFKRQPPPRQGTLTPTPVINIAGSWHDPNNPGNGSRITQDENSFQFDGWGVLPQGIRFKSSGSGTISGQGIKSTYTTTYQNGWIARGSCSGDVSSNGAQITSTCTDNVLGTFIISGVR